MTFTWTWWALLGFASVLFSWGMAAVVYATRPDRLQNRLLALFLVFAGATWLAYNGIMQIVADPEAARLAMVAMMALHVLGHFTHLLFLSTLPSPLVRPLRSKWVLAGLGVVSLAWSAHIVLYSMQWTPGVVATTAVGTWAFLPGPNFLRYWWFLDLMWWFGLAVSITAFANRGAWRDRQQARAYFAAFTIHDGGFAILLALFLLNVPLPPVAAEFVGLVPWPVLNILLTSLLAYGILRTQLFDIDLRVKRGIARGAVAALIPGVFLVVGELAERTLPFESAVPAFAAAILVALAFRPLERRALRLMDRVMPEATGSAAYVGDRKAAVYRAAVEEMLKDGELSEEDRGILAALRQRLGISEEAAAALAATPSAGR